MKKTLWLNLFVLVAAFLGNGFLIAEEPILKPASEAVISTENIKNFKDLSNTQKNKINPENANDSQKQGRIWSLLVGYCFTENDAGRIPEYSQNDVFQMSAAMKELGVSAENIIQMTSQAKEFYLKPTRKNILSMLRLLAEHANPNDTLWIMFSGIGTAVEQESCFLPQGANLGQANRWITLSEIRHILSRTKAKNSFVLWLADRPIVTNVKIEDLSKGAQNNVAQEEQSKVKGTIFFSCALNSYTAESHEKQLDPFLAEFITAMKADSECFYTNPVTLFEKSKAAITEQSKDSSQKNVQVPEMETWE